MLDTSNLSIWNMKRNSIPLDSVGKPEVITTSFKDMKGVTLERKYMMKMNVQILSFLLKIMETP